MLSPQPPQRHARLLSAGLAEAVSSHEQRVRRPRAQPRDTTCVTEAAESACRKAVSEKAGKEEEETIYYDVF